MVKLYAVVLEPFKPAKPISKSFSPVKENKIYAVISESTILVAENSALALGYKYQEWHKKENEKNSSIANVLSYVIPGEILCTKNRAFRIKNLGQLFIQDFEKGLLAEANRHD